MPVAEHYQVDFFAITVLIVSIMVLVFLIITSVYFYSLMYMRPPSRGESTFLFWTSIILTVILIGVSIYALIHIFTYKPTIYEEQPQEIIRTPARVTVKTPVKTYKPVTTREYSDIPINKAQRTELNRELINLAGAMGD